MAKKRTWRNSHHSLDTSNQKWHRSTSLILLDKASYMTVSNLKEACAQKEEENQRLCWTFVCLLQNICFVPFHKIMLPQLRMFISSVSNDWPANEVSFWTYSQNNFKTPVHFFQSTLGKRFSKRPCYLVVKCLRFAVRTTVQTIFTTYYLWDLGLSVLHFQWKGNKNGINLIDFFWALKIMHKSTVFDI